MSSLSERLRDAAAVVRPERAFYDVLCREAADRLDELESDVELLQTYLAQSRGYGLIMGEKVEALEAALRNLYDWMPRYMCESDEPDRCPVCVARELLNNPDV